MFEVKDYRSIALDPDLAIACPDEVSFCGWLVVVDFTWIISDMAC